MNHPHEDRLLLLAYGELPEAEAAELETHLSACALCRDDLERLERARVALDWAVPNARRPGRWIVPGLAAAAVLALVLLRTGSGTSPLSLTLHPPRYTAPALAPIDSLLTRLEQERLYAIP
jgi:hypothetical protein